MTWFLFDLLINSVKMVHCGSQDVWSREDTLLSQPSGRIDSYMMRKKSYGGIIDTNTVLEERRDVFYLLCFIVHNTKPVGHQVPLTVICQEICSFCLSNFTSF